MALLRWKTPVGVRPRLNLIIGNGSIEGRMIRLVPKENTDRTVCRQAG